MRSKPFLISFLSIIVFAFVVVGMFVSGQQSDEIPKSRRAILFSNDPQWERQLESIKPDFELPENSIYNYEKFAKTGQHDMLSEKALRHITDSWLLSHNVSEILEIHTGIITVGEFYHMLGEEWIFFGEPDQSILVVGSRVKQHGYKGEFTLTLIIDPTTGWRIYSGPDFIKPQESTGAQAKAVIIPTYAPEVTQEPLPLPLPTAEPESLPQGFRR